MPSTKRSTAAADKWVAALLDKRGAESARDDVRTLARAAFHLYAEAWGPGWNISGWEWPFNEIANGGDFAAGDQPWTVLLRRAVELTAAEVTP